MLFKALVTVFTFGIKVSDPVAFRRNVIVWKVNQGVHGSMGVYAWGVGVGKQVL